MNRIGVIITLLLIIAFGLFRLYPDARTEFVFDVRDGKSAMVYSCHNLETEAHTLVQAEKAHHYYLNQTTLLAHAHARAMHNAMLTANATGNLQDLEEIAAVIPDQRRELVADVDRTFGCRLIEERPA